MSKTCVLHKIKIDQKKFLEIFISDLSTCNVDVRVSCDTDKNFLVTINFSKKYDFCDLLVSIVNFIKYSDIVSRETISDFLNLHKEGISDLNKEDILNLFSSSNPIRKITVKVSNVHGLHARPAAKLVKIANSFKSKIWIKTPQNKVINAKDFLQIITQEIKLNEEIEILSQGIDSLEALKRIKQTFDNKFE